MPPRLARLLAIIGVVVLVVGAFALRGALMGDDDGESVTTGSGEDPSGREPSDDEPPTGSYRVICDDDLGDACDVIERLEGVDELEVLRAGDALDQLRAEDPLDADLWITVDPWPSMLDAPGVSQGLRTGGDPLALASSGVAVLAYPNDQGCTTDPTWRCLADLAAVTDPAAAVDIGLPTVGTATGTVVLGHAAVGLVGRTDFGSNTVTDDPAVDGAISSLLASGRPATTADQVEALLVQRGAYDAAVTTQGLASEGSESSSGQGSRLTVAAVSPEALLGVVAAPLGSRGEDALDRLQEGLKGQDVLDALVAAGWTGGPNRSSGLPDPDVIYALDKEYRR